MYSKFNVLTLIIYLKNLFMQELALNIDRNLKHDNSPVSSYRFNQIVKQFEIDGVVRFKN